MGRTPLPWDSQGPGLRSIEEIEGLTDADIATCLTRYGITELPTRSTARLTRKARRKLLEVLVGAPFPYCKVEGGRRDLRGQWNAIAAQVIGDHFTYCNNLERLHHIGLEARARSLIVRLGLWTKRTS